MPSLNVTCQWCNIKGEVCVDLIDENHHCLCGHKLLSHQRSPFSDMVCRLYDCNCKSYRYAGSGPVPPQERIPRSTAKKTIKCICGHTNLQHRTYGVLPCFHCKKCTKFQSSISCNVCGLREEQHKTVVKDSSVSLSAATTTTTASASSSRENVHNNNGKNNLKYIASNNHTNNRNKRNKHRGDHRDNNILPRMNLSQPKEEEPSPLWKHLLTSSNSNRLLRDEKHQHEQQHQHHMYHSNSASEARLTPRMKINNDTQLERAKSSTNYKQHDRQETPRGIGRQHHQRKIEPLYYIKEKNPFDDNRNNNDNDNDNDRNDMKQITRQNQNNIHVYNDNNSDNNEEVSVLDATFDRHEKLTHDLRKVIDTGISNIPRHNTVSTSSPSVNYEDEVVNINLYRHGVYFNNRNSSMGAWSDDEEDHMM